MIKRLAGPVAASKSNTTLLTVPPRSQYALQSIIACNTASRRAKINLAVNGKMFIRAQSVPANATTVLYPGIVLVGNDALQACASATTVTFTVMGEK